MKYTDLILTRASGTVYSENTQYSAKKDNANGKVAEVHFVNQGSVNSIVVISVGNSRVSLARNQAVSFTAPYGGYDSSTYDIEFHTTGGGTTNVLVLTVQKYFPDEK